jgi:hypothetical protein
MSVPARSSSQIYGEKFADENCTYSNLVSTGCSPFCGRTSTPEALSAVLSHRRPVSFDQFCSPIEAFRVRADTCRPKSVLLSDSEGATETENISPLSIMLCAYVITDQGFSAWQTPERTRMDPSVSPQEARSCTECAALPGIKILTLAAVLLLWFRCLCQSFCARLKRLGLVSSRKRCRVGKVMSYHLP